MTAGDGFIAYVTPQGLPPVAYVERLDRTPSVFYAAPSEFTQGVELSTTETPTGEVLIAAPKNVPGATGVFTLEGTLMSDLAGIGIPVG